MSNDAKAPSSKAMTRRDLLQSASAATVVGLLNSNGLAQAAMAAGQDKSKAFPSKFLWGAATAAHQVEGNNTNSDLWLIEHLAKTMFKEPSGDACDHYHLYPQDISMLADLGFNTYRFSLEWARIEPEEGLFSNAELEHYRRMIAACREHDVTPMVTYSHFSLPRWVAYQGAWTNPKAPDLFARYCERATQHFGDMIGYASTLNEPDLPTFLSWISLPNGQSVNDMMQSGLGDVREQLHAPEFSNFFMGDLKRTRDGLLAAHQKGKAAMKSVRADLPVGFNLALSDDQPAPHDSHLKQKRAEVYGPWIDLAKHDDYMGVQVYSRSIVGKSDLNPAPGVELTQSGMEFYPECVEHVVTYAAKATGVPIIVTENGIATLDDSRRIEYVRRAVAGLKRAIDSGVDVRGYIGWSLLDNFEWMSGFTPKFGIVAVDRSTQKRTIKPSAAVLGNIARNNSL